MFILLFNSNYLKPVITVNLFLSERIYNLKNNQVHARKYPFKVLGSNNKQIYLPHFSRWDISLHPFCIPWLSYSKIHLYLDKTTCPFLHVIVLPTCCDPIAEMNKLK